MTNRSHEIHPKRPSRDRAAEKAVQDAKGDTRPRQRFSVLSTVFESLAALRRAVWATPALVLALALTACPGIQPTSGFSLELSSPNLSLQQGASANVTVNLTRSGGFADAVTVTLASPPAGISAQPLTIAGHSSTGSLRIDASSGAALGPNLLSLTGASGTLSASTSLSLSLSAPSPSPTPNPMLGSLEVSIAGLPSGTNANVNLSGPGGYSRMLTASQTLTGLTPGSYSITAANLTAGGVTFASSLTGSPANISAGTVSKASVSYAAQTGSLQVNITGLDSGVNAAVTIAGPGGFSQLLSASKTLTGLAPGNYAFSPAKVISGGTVFTPPVGGTVAVAAGGTTTVTVPYQPTRASLRVDIAGLPSGVRGNVVVTGPGGFRTALGVSSILSGLAPGSYAIEMGTVRTPGSVVDLIYEATGPDTLNVAAGASTTALVNYALRPGGPAIWLPTFTGQLRAYSASVLGFGGTSGVLPNATLGTSAGGSNAAVAFDARSNLWTLNSATNTLLEFTPQQLAKSGAPTPVRTITGSLNRPASLAFDANGNLWVANLGNDTIQMFTAYQLAQVNDPTPGLVISANTSAFWPSLHGVTSLAFDKDGNLWALNAASPETLVRFTPDQLTRSGNPVPSITIATSFSAAANLAIDAQGNLWVTDFGANSLVMYAAAQLSSSTPRPSVTLRSNGSAISQPTGLAFDSSGDLWIANSGNNTLVEFTPDQLTSDGAPDAMSTITGISNLAWGSIAFDPPSSSLPLFH